jgi:uncharacterized protein YkwD
LSISLVFAAMAPARESKIQDLKGAKTTGGGFSFNSKEACFMKKINKIRLRHGLPKASSDPQLGYVARKHARTIARDGAVYHDDRFGERVTNWIRLGQNTGRGGGCRSITRAFMNDQTHREIILGQWSFMGVGVDSAGGRIYVQQLFESRKNPGNVYNTP